MHQAAAKAVQASDVIDKLVATGSTPVGITPAAFEVCINAQLKSWGEVTRKAGIRGD